MNRLAKYLAITSICLPQLASAAPFDGSMPFICALISENLCSADSQCEAQSSSDNDVPRFLKISVQGKKVTGTRPSGAKIDADIEAIRQSSNNLYLLGSQDAFTWSMAIDKEDGEMTLTAANTSNGMVIFGACTLP